MERVTGMCSLAQLGYEGPFATQCSKAIDKELKAAEGMYSGKLMAYLSSLIDKIFVFDVQEILADSADCFCAAGLMTKNGGLLVLVPWPAQYAQGACVALYRKGDVEEFEIEMILAQLVEIIQLGEHANDQRYLM